MKKQIIMNLSLSIYAIKISVLTLLILGCRETSQDTPPMSTETGISNLFRQLRDSIENEIASAQFRDSLYNRESAHFVSKLEEIPNRDSNAYKLTIASRDGKKRISKILNTRPQMSRISYCNDLYTAVGFPCGGPCYTDIFVLTDGSKTKQFQFSQRISNKPNLIAHIKEEDFQTLRIHNLINDKELRIDISDCFHLNYTQMDTLYVLQNKLYIEYPNTTYKTVKKAVSISAILN
jgi:hypothetical protein